MSALQEELINAVARGLIAPVLVQTPEDGLMNIREITVSSSVRK